MLCLGQRGDVLRRVPQGNERLAPGRPQLRNGRSFSSTRSAWIASMFPTTSEVG
jgi:hypothetical protein